MQYRLFFIELLFYLINCTHRLSQKLAQQVLRIQEITQKMNFKIIYYKVMQKIKRLPIILELYQRSQKIKINKSKSKQPHTLFLIFHKHLPIHKIISFHSLQMKPKDQQKNQKFRNPLIQSEVELKKSINCIKKSIYPLQDNANQLSLQQKQAETECKTAESNRIKITICELQSQIARLRFQRQQYHDFIYESSLKVEQNLKQEQSIFEQQNETVENLVRCQEPTSGNFNQKILTYKIAYTSMKMNYQIN